MTSSTTPEPRVCPLHGEDGCDFYHEPRFVVHGTVTGRINREPSPYHPANRARIYDLDEDA